MAKKNKPRMPGGMGGNPMGMMQQIQQMQQQMLEAQNKLAEETITGSAGGGVVKVTVTGDQVCTKVEIAKELLADGDVDLLQDLVMAATNGALEASRKLAQDRLGPMASGLSGLVPGM